MAKKSQAEEAFTQATEGSTESKVNDSQAVYEIGFHVVPQVGDDGVGAVVEGIRKLLGEAEIITEQFPAKMNLAYTIERATQGKREKFDTSYFGWIKFVTSRDAVAAIERGLRADRNILRHLFIETVRENTMEQPRRAVFTSDRLEGQTLEKPVAAVAEKPAEVSEEELDKSLEGLGAI